MSCKLCDDPIFNSHFKLCKKHNQERLNDKKPKEVSKKFPINLTTKKVIKKQVKRTIIKINLDEEFYQQCFDSCIDHCCEECGKLLPDIFRDDKGKVINKSRYSHIVAKSIAPQLRHDIKNINHLCFNCHFKWEFGDKKSMRIYESNKKRFPNYLK